MKKFQREYPVSQEKMVKTLISILLAWGMATLGILLGDIIESMLNQIWSRFLFFPFPTLLLFLLIFAFATYRFFFWLRLMADPAPLEVMIFDEKIVLSTSYKRVELSYDDVDRVNGSSYSGVLEFYRFAHGASTVLLSVERIVCLGYTISARRLAEVINEALKQRS